METYRKSPEAPKPHGAVMSRRNALRGILTLSAAASISACTTVMPSNVEQNNTSGVVQEVNRFISLKKAVISEIESLELEIYDLGESPETKEILEKIYEHKEYIGPFLMAGQETAANILFSIIDKSDIYEMEKMKGILEEVNKNIILVRKNIDELRIKVEKMIMEKWGALA